MAGTIRHERNPRYFIGQDQLWSVSQTNGANIEVRCGGIGELDLVAELTFNDPFPMALLDKRIIEPRGDALVIGPVPRIVINSDGSVADDSAEWGDDMPSALAVETTDEHGRIVVVWNGRRNQPTDASTRVELPPLEGLDTTTMSELVAIGGQLRGITRDPGDAQYYVWDRATGGRWVPLKSSVWSVRTFVAVGKSIVARAKTEKGEGIVRIQGKGTVSLLSSVPQLSGLEIVPLGRRGVAYEDDGVLKAVALNGEIVDLGRGNYRPHHGTNARLVCAEYGYEQGPHGMSVVREHGPVIFDIPDDFGR